jgi:hypothetical protein
MKRVSIVTLSVLVPFVALSAPACSSESPPDEGNNTGNTSGTGNSSAGTGTLPPVAGTTSSAAGTSAGGATGGAAGSGSGGTTAGTSSGGSGTAGNAGAASGGTSAGGSAGATAGGSGGGTANPNCPVKIDSKTACTAVATCNDAYCGVFKLGAKDCTCAAASGMFMCNSCDYTGKTEEIVLPPASALPACTADDMTLESTTGCTKGMRCRSTDTAKIRFCACWDDPVEGGTVWDCDALPASWPK